MSVYLLVLLPSYVALLRLHEWKLFNSSLSRLAHLHIHSLLLAVACLTADRALRGYAAASLLHFAPQRFAPLQSLTGFHNKPFLSPANFLAENRENTSIFTVFCHFNTIFLSPPANYNLGE